MSEGLTAKLLHTERFQRSFYKPPSISWSEGNCICIPCEEGVHIYEPKLGKVDAISAPTVIYMQKIITAPAETNVFDVQVDRGFLNNYLPLEYISDLMLDRTLSPLVACKPSYKGFYQAKWSPSCIGQQKSCVLATLTMDHRLSLYAYRDGCLTMTAELSALYCENMKSNFTPYTMNDHIPEKENAVKMLKQFANEVYSISAVEIEWTHKFRCSHSNTSDEELHSFKWACVLIVGMKDGSLVFWTIASPCTDSDPVITSSVQTDLNCLSSVKWQKINETAGLLAVGSKRGKGKLYKCIIETLDNTVHIVLKELALLWDLEDEIPLDNLCWNVVDNDEYHLIASKNAYYLGWVVQDLTVKYFKYVSKDSYLPVSGICKVGNVFVAAPANSPVSCITFTMKPEFCISVETVSSCPETNDTVNYGIGCSPSGAIICLLQTMDGQRENRIITEPHLVSYFTFLSPGEIKVLLSRNLDDFSAIKDILTCYCLLWQSENTTRKQCESLFELIPKENLVDKSTAQLMLYRWLLHFMKLHDDLNQNPVNALLYNEINSLLLMRHLISLDKRSGFFELKNTIDDAWKTRVGVICQYIMRNRTHFKDDKIIESVEKFLKLGGFPHETCQICHLEINMADIEVAKCGNQHVFGRCCLTLAPNDAHYRKCSGCSSTASVVALAMFPAAECPYCGSGFL